MNFDIELMFMSITSHVEFVFIGEKLSEAKFERHVVTISPANPRSDRHILPGKFIEVFIIRKTSFSTSPAVAIGLFGIGMLMGQLLNYKGEGQTKKKCGFMILLGLDLGQLWGQFYLH